MSFINSIYRRGARMTKITDIKTYLTCPHGYNLVVVRVDTDQPGLYGLGCATFTQRCKAVVTVIEEYLKPLIVGRDADEIQELWQLMNQNAYWRNGPVLNMATGGVDMAMWDIKGKLVGLPVYQLLGGKCREAVAVYRYANGESQEEIVDKARKLWEEGCHHIRLQYNPSGEHPALSSDWRPAGAKPGFYLDPRKYVPRVIDLVAAAREALGPDAEFIHDVHERLPPSDALYLARALEPLRMFFLEDLFAPEQN
ncbi:MAG: bifunctional D-altronate/D-mannonate dehydratase, partial [Synergistaceae bacterium]|nr:bifunctional D-altronate/D-mannonate dehydratase [Synergistaceae bacterium]